MNRVGPTGPSSYRGPTSTALPYLKLVRVGTLFSPAADVVAGACLAQLPWSPDLVRAALASVAVYAAGMVLNDHADRRIDAVQRPERPIPRGEITPGRALMLGGALLVACLALAPSRPYYAGIAGLVLAYDYLLKRSPAGGALAMGALRGLNLLAGAVAVVPLAPPRVAVIAAAVYGVYIVAVTLLGVLEDMPATKPRVVISLQLVPPSCAALALLGMPEPWPAAALGFALAAAFFARVARVPGWDRTAIRGSMTWLLLGTMLYTGLLCLAAGRPVEWLCIWAAALVARRISRWIMLT